MNGIGAIVGLKVARINTALANLIADMNEIAQFDNPSTATVEYLDKVIARARSAYVELNR